MSGTWRTGQFVWRELTTSNVTSARRFYGELFGWSFEESDAGGFSYASIKLGERHIGGIMPIEHAMAGAPVCWTPYLSVADVDATLSTFESLGGKAHPARDIPGVGRFAVAADAGQAVLCLFRSLDGDDPVVQAGPGDFHWETLTSRDVEATIQFYTRAVGWTCGPGPAGTGKVLAAQSVDVADLAPSQTSAWYSYVAVADLTSAMDRAAQLGAQVLMARIDIPRVGATAFIADPEGARLGLFEPLPR
jgi:predicted enzyme related to lactoylglutathione lyase